MTESLIENESIDFEELYAMVGKYEPALAEAAKVNFPPEMSTRDPAASV